MPERWQRTEAVLDAALRASPADRDRIIDEMCADDVDLRRVARLNLFSHPTHNPKDFSTPRRNHSRRHSLSHQRLVSQAIAPELQSDDTGW